MNRFEIMMEILEPIKEDILSISVNAHCKSVSVCVATVDVLRTLCAETEIVRVPNPEDWALKYMYVATIGNIEYYAFSDE